eukprot:CAMPEP_0198348864 /NCGR_PEP_ID=MMETSP1450-20131203/91595_1 /TAXON_ID=753684 ORGANISM="Madagascaria erythrocladiodes, Strain CCMP3234" /NCGR_SAMPLE_ID=MMETSP1450 /ASSEMBLY_ACC=CAM_ASM_001115 /LENGTH=34 /DNA_ID= /DNA_START= /DNA_END= /DNA_ORIENTATION=
MALLAAETRMGSVCPRLQNEYSGSESSKGELHFA